VGESTEGYALARTLCLEVDGVRQSPDRARLVQDTLRAIPGVVQVTTDPRTGSVLLQYDPDWSNRRGGGDAPSVPPGGDGVHVKPRSSAALWTGWLVRTVLVVTLEVALQRALGPFFPRRC
jgi:hypothetical protein